MPNRNARRSSCSSTKTEIRCVQSRCIHESGRLALHLQPRDARLKTGVAALAVVQSLFQPFGKHPAFTGYGFITDCIVVVVHSDIVLSRLQSAFMPVRPTPLQNCVGYDMAVPI